MTSLAGMDPDTCRIPV